MRRLLFAVLALSLLAASASALEVSSDTSKFSATTVSYSGSTFTLWQGYFTITVTNGGTPVAGVDVRGTALGEQVTSVEATNSTGKAVLPMITDVQPSLIHIQTRTSSSSPWEDSTEKPVDPAPVGSAPGGVAAGGGAAGGGAPAGAAPVPPPAAPPEGAVAILPSFRSGLAPGGLFNAFRPNTDWVPAAAPEAAAAASGAAAVGGFGMAQAVILDALMVGGAVGYAMFARIRPGRAR